MRNAGLIFLGIILCFLSRSVIRAEAYMEISARPGGLDTFEIIRNGSSIGELQFSFVPVIPNGMRILETTRSLVSLIRSPSGSYQLVKWRIAPPDRDDHFSVRWKGIWHPGPMDCEIKLEADDLAILYLGGKKRLYCGPESKVASGEFHLDGRYYDIRLDYSEKTGPAFVSLMWRRSREHKWYPLVPFSGRQGNRLSKPGWKATYFLGKNFSFPEMEQVDSSIDFDWQARGPFNRDIDLPSAILEWGRDGSGHLIGQIRSNRSVRVIIQGKPIRRTVERTGSISKTFVAVSEKRIPIPFTGLEFDTPGEEVAAATEASRSDQNDSFLFRRSFQLEKNRPVRFWEKGSSTHDGAGVSSALKDARETFFRHRTRLEGQFSSLDAPVLLNGRGWIYLLVRRMNSPETTGCTSLQDGRITEIPGGMVGNLMEAVSSYVELLAPDLKPEAVPVLHFSGELPGCVFRDCTVSELLQLRNALIDWKRQQGLDPSDPLSRLDADDFPFPLREEPQSLAGGLQEMIRGLTFLERFVNHEEDSGVNIGNLHVVSGPYTLSNWNYDNTPLSISTDSSSLRIEEGNSLAIRFSCPVILRGFRPRAQEDRMILHVQMSSPGSFSVQPVSRIRGAFWDGIPILLTRQGFFYQSSRLPSASGELVVSLR